MLICSFPCISKFWVAFGKHEYSKSCFLWNLFWDIPTWSSQSIFLTDTPTKHFPLWERGPLDSHKSMSSSCYKKTFDIDSVQWSGWKHCIHCLGLSLIAFGYKPNQPVPSASKIKRPAPWAQCSLSPPYPNCCCLAVQPHSYTDHVGGPCMHWAWILLHFFSF